ncbi:putative regulator of nonsense transcripts [Vairimorpha necatrix]|uniref:Regulator of nonsense transcripts n=1 Tax=Vairimorpha necatrix TaxID=6039 RepID=A0AAX4JHS7_9MICR
MNWSLERLHLSQNKPLLNRNSQLKKKMNLVKKVKNLNSENMEILFNELYEENMEQFYSEIVNSLLNIKISSIEDIKNVIRIISIYSKDNKFINNLYLNLNYKINYWHKIVFIESHLLNNDSYKPNKDVMNLFLDQNIIHKIFYIEYIMCFHEDKKLLELANIEKKKIGMIDLELIKEKEVERIINACRVIDLPYDEHKEDTNFKQVIEAQKNEFDFYTSRCSGDESVSVPKNAKEIVEFLKNNSNDIAKIDETSKFLRKSENVKMISVVYNKLRHNLCYLPMLARIIKNCGMICKKSINKILEEMIENRINNRNDQINGIYLITELVKFRYINPNECFNLLEHFFRQKDIEICCLILKNVSRFYLIDEQLNSRTRDFLDKILSYGNKCSNIECIFINDMITKVFPKNETNNLMNLDGFLSDHFQKDIFKFNGELYEILKKNKKFVFSLLCTPWKFKDMDFLIFLSQNFLLDKIIIDFFIFIINLIGETYKLKAIYYTKVVSGLLRCIDYTEQENFINKFYQMNIKKEVKVRIIISLISGMGYCVKTRHIPFLKQICSQLRSVEIQNLLFNLCESIGVKYEVSVDEDSLDEEIRLMERL